MKKMILLFLLATIGIVKVNAQKLILAGEADVWGMPQTIKLNDGGQIQLRTMFIKHYGATCVFKIEFTNMGTTTVKEEVQLIDPAKKGIYTHWSTTLKLSTGEAKIYEMEKRECSLIFGKKKQKDIKKCAACKPTILFLKK